MPQNLRQACTYMEYTELKNRYPLFWFHDFTLIESDEEFRVQYDFEIEGLSHFNPDFIISKPDPDAVYGNLRAVREAAFALGMVELISYWKLTCAPKVVVKCGSLDEDQIRWWKTLYYHGLSEFFRQNQITADPDTFMDLSATGEPITGQVDQRVYHGNLIPVGGGKDSFVTLELVKQMGEDNRAFIVNHVMSAVHAAFAAGYRGDTLLIAERTLDSRMLEFNKGGFLNGHTPFAALCAFAAALTAIIYGIQNICLSNEDSASEPALRDRSLSRRYSKTFRFEQDFKHYMDTYITPEVHCFSLLRPLSELQITGLFSTMKEYLPVFRSCNVGQKEEKWCGHCEKCLFVCILLSAYLDDETLCSIFHSDMLNNADLQELFDRLTGSEADSSVLAGTRDEVNTAIAMSIAAHEKAGQPLPLLYQNYTQTPLYAAYQNKRVDWDAFQEENLVPESMKPVLRQWIAERRPQ